MSFGQSVKIRSRHQTATRVIRTISTDLLPPPLVKHSSRGLRASRIFPSSFPGCVPRWNGSERDSTSPLFKWILPLRFCGNAVGERGVGERERIKGYRFCPRVTRSRCFEIKTFFFFLFFSRKREREREILRFIDRSYFFKRCVPG